MSDVMVLPHGPEVAVMGLREAVSRLRDAVGSVLRGQGGQPVWISLSEALYWVAALDDHYRGADYFSRRNTDPGGRTVGGLVYARNSHAHELVSAGEAVFEVATLQVVQTRPNEPKPPPGRGPWFSMQLRWISLDDLPAPAREEKQGRDAMYRDHVGGRPITHPFDGAIEWLSRYCGSEVAEQRQL